MGQREMVQDSLNAEHDHGVYGRRLGQRRVLPGRRDEDAWYPTRAVERHEFHSPTVLPGPITVRTNHGDTVPLLRDDDLRPGVTRAEFVRALADGTLPVVPMTGVSPNRQGWKPRLHRVEMLLAEAVDDAHTERSESVNEPLTVCDTASVQRALAELRSILDGE